MRCKNCGWPNRPGETTCAKCSTPLEISEQPETEVAPVVEEKPRNLKATVLETASSDPVQAVEDETEDTDMCPKCGYPMRKNTNKCPNCNYVINTNQNNNLEHHQTRMEQSAQSNKPISSTINPYLVGSAPEPGFTLTPVKRINERKTFESILYEGQEVELRRDNTEADNTSITSQEQAVIHNENGNWYITDKSEQGTTFVRATNKTQLQDGDIILLGNRLFEFRSTDN